MSNPPKTAQLQAVTQPPGSRLSIGLRVAARTSGGGQVFVQRLLEALSRHPSNPRLTLFVVGDLPKRWWPESVPAVSVAPTGQPIIERLMARQKLPRALRRHAVDVLLCPGTAAVSAPATKVVLWPLTVAPFERTTRDLLGTTPAARLRWFMLRRLIVRACSSVDAAVFSSAYARDLHIARAPHLADVPTAVALPAASLEVGAQRGKATPTPRCEGHWLFVSHLYPYKGVIPMIEGFAEARARGAATTPLVIAGAAVDPHYADEIAATIERLGIAEHVQLRGSLSGPELSALYANARAFIFPSFSENAGSYALLDAFAYGLPVLSSSRSSMPEIVGDAALFFDPEVPSELADRIEELAFQPDLEHDLARRSAERIKHFPTWDDIAASFVKVATEVANSPVRRPPEIQETP